MSDSVDTDIVVRLRHAKASAREAIQCVEAIIEADAWQMDRDDVARLVATVADLTCVIASLEHVERAELAERKKLGL